MLFTYTSPSPTLFLYPVLYGFALAYLAAPGTFDSAHVLAFVAGLPEYIKMSAKVVLAAPFAFHSWNGVRHLVWDLGKCAWPLFFVWSFRPGAELGGH